MSMKSLQMWLWQMFSFLGKSIKRKWIFFFIIFSYIEKLDLHRVRKEHTYTSSSVHFESYEVLLAISCLVQCIPLVNNKFLKHSLWSPKTFKELSSRNRGKKKSLTQVTRTDLFKILFSCCWSKFWSIKLVKCHLIA